MNETSEICEDKDAIGSYYFHFYLHLTDRQPWNCNPEQFDRESPWTVRKVKMHLQDCYNKSKPEILSGSYTIRAPFLCIDIVAISQDDEYPRQDTFVELRNELNTGEIDRLERSPNLS